MINASLVDSAIAKAASLLGIQLFRDARSGDDYDFSVRLAAYPFPKGLSVRVADEYMVWSVNVVLDDLSLKLIQLMNDRAQAKSAEFEQALTSIEKATDSCQVLISGQARSLTPLTEAWTDFEIQLALGFSVETQLDRLVEAIVYAISLPVILLQDEEIPRIDATSDETPRLEGDLRSVLHNVYERSRFNRALCLRYHGFTCKACGDKLANKYGFIATELVHVHHIKPVSTLGGPSVVDPVVDLIPLCPNCHNVIHRTNPPMSLEALVGLISDSRSSLEK